MFTNSRFGLSGCDGKKRIYTNWKKHETPTETQKNYEPGHARVKNRYSERTKGKQDHRKKSGVFGKAKCLRPQDSGYQVATEKKNKLIGKTRNTERHGEDTMSLEKEE